jgi:hypothetical protein
VNLFKMLRLAAGASVYHSDVTVCDDRDQDRRVN